jgi:putative OPT family oligopeptide transporter
MEHATSSAQAIARHDDEDPEQRWRNEVYQSGVAQLTPRAVVVGMLIGGVMCLSNLYVFFKTGWSLGVTLTACILAFATFQALHKLGLKKMGALENNALTTVSAGAGFMTGGGNMAAFGALLMVTTVRPNAWMMVAWFAAIAALGVFAAIPIKRQLVNREALSFPTGTATAETIRSLYAEGNQEGGSKATVLGVTALFAALLTFFRDVNLKSLPFLRIPADIGLPFSIAGRAAAEWTLKLKMEAVLIGAGALMSLRAGWSVLLGAILTYGILAPSLVEQGIVATVNYKSIIAWTLWPGAAMLVTSGLTSFALDYKSIGRAFSGLLTPRGQQRADVLADLETPASWFPIGFAVLSPVVVILMTVLFQIPWWAGVVAVPLAVLMGFIAARVTGETDVTPTKALGPVTQLLFGVMTPGNMAGNIMSANVTGGIGLHAADLCTTAKTGWLLGANPRSQFFAQLFGVAAGAMVVVPAFYLLIPDPSVLGGEEWPAPSCVVWAGVSKAFGGGISSLPSSAQMAAVVGGVLGVLMALMEKFAPKKVVAFMPSPSALGVAMVIPGANSISMFIGAVIADLIKRKKPALADKLVVPVASGLIAGESLMGILIAIGIVTGLVPK